MQDGISNRRKKELVLDSHPEKNYSNASKHLIVESACTRVEEGPGATKILEPICAEFGFWFKRLFRRRTNQRDPLFKINAQHLQFQN